MVGSRKLTGKGWRSGRLSQLDLLVGLADRIPEDLACCVVLLGALLDGDADAIPHDVLRLGWVDGTDDGIDQVLCGIVHHLGVMKRHQAADDVK